MEVDGTGRLWRKRVIRSGPCHPLSMMISGRVYKEHVPVCKGAPTPAHFWAEPCHVYNKETLP